MAQSGKGKLNYRCPSCFMRDLDIDMFYDKDGTAVLDAAGFSGSLLCCGQIRFPRHYRHGGKPQALHRRESAEGA